MMDGATEEDAYEDIEEKTAESNSEPSPEPDPEEEFEPEPEEEHGPPSGAQESALMEGDEGWVPPEEKVADPFGAPAAEDGQVTEVASEESEFSENIGSGDIDDQGPSDFDDLPEEDFQ